MYRRTIFYRSFQVTVTIILLMFIMACSYYPAIKPLNNDSHSNVNEIEEGNDTTNTSESGLSIDVETEKNSEVNPDPLEKEKEKDDKEYKRIALTFDDGPDLKYTPQVLDILKEKHVHATFFVVGIQVNKYPEMLERIVNEGHSLGNHSYSHRSFTKLTPEEIMQEIEKTDRAMMDAVGFIPNMVRPPYGATNDDVTDILEKYGREEVLWNIDPRDWAGTSVKEMFANVKKNARDGGNILLHSFGGKHIANTVDLLPMLIDELLEQGYTFVAADELG